MVVLCVPGNDGCPMTSGLSCYPSCSFGTPSWSPRQRRSRPRCWSWKTIRNSPTRSRPGCEFVHPDDRAAVEEARQERALQAVLASCVLLGPEAPAREPREQLRCRAAEDSRPLADREFGVGFDVLAAGDG